MNASPREELCPPAPSSSGLAPTPSRRNAHAERRFPRGQGLPVRVCFFAFGASHQASDSKVASVLPNAVNFSGAGHFPHVTHPEQFVQLVSAFIGDNSE
jgi:pimeloyl-ACP methyl ester carboxylesterase